MWRFFLAAMDGGHAGNAGAFSCAPRIGTPQMRQPFVAPDFVKSHYGSY
jgi:hypothetical protein